ncbi:uncharacterized protein LOC132708357 [Cylas formicarius]|uniref:uncharacterized protein LOC132708357 n=1 Tax=Cylas formicarius TaxID=197179 RepID=UPI002958C051|nr:uncharacterized protein LOC132708357 [Cylas formicarius]XP_060536639.1 uncharacterized protein LOC132708357 [Cylas formicarius]
MSDKPGPISRPMKYPYTFSAKIAQFPWKFFAKHNWIVRYYVFGFLSAFPVFVAVGRLANSPENVAKWAEIRRKEAEGHHH